MKKWILIFALWLAMTATASAQSFSAKVNRNTVPEGETFLLTLELEGATSNNTPDLSVIDDNFTIYSVSNAYRTNIINGAMEQSRQWNLVLMPKHSGNLAIPAIKLDNYSSAPVTIKVVAAGEDVNAPAAANGQASQPQFRIDGKVDNLSPYVQQQINYTLTLYDTGGLQGEQPIFMTSGNDWIIRDLGAPQISSQVIDGRTVREIKFRYALFAQKSGELRVPEMKFNGYYLSKDSRRDPFGQIFGDDLFVAGFGMTDVFATRNPIVLSAKPIKLNVRPAAAANNGNWWLPASDVELVAKFEPANPVFKAGEAISRTIYLKATGVIDTQLPEIVFPEVAGVKQYPEKPVTEMKVENGQVVSLEKIANVYIPSQPGEVTLAEIGVSWFNVKTGKMERAALPAQTIKVRPGATTVAPQAPTAAKVEPTAKPEPMMEAMEVVEGVKPMPIYLLLGGAFAAGILVSWIIMKSLSPKKEKTVRNHKKNVLQKAETKDLRGLRDALLLWAASHYRRPNLASLQEVGALSNAPAFQEELEKLTRALYANSDENWNARNFIKAFEKVNAAKTRKKTDDEPLPKLYKN